MSGVHWVVMSALLTLLVGCGTNQDTFLFEERTFVDETRPLPALGPQEATDSREILLYAWSDAGSGVQGRPLVVIAHGIDGHPRKFDTFATELAEQGLFVVALAFPSSNDETGAGVAGVADLGNQPGDLTATLDHLAEAVADPSDPFYRRFDPDVLGVVGHSLGAGTVAGWTRFGCCEPQPPDAVALLAVAHTPMSLIFGEPDPVGPPTLLVHGTEDGTLPVGESLSFAAQIDEVALVLLTGVGHSEAIESSGAEPARDHFRTLVLGHFTEQLLGEAGALDAALSDSMFADDEIRTGL